MNTGN